MGNLVRKKAQVLVNTVDSESITYSATNPLAFKDYNQILQTDKVLKFKKSSYAVGTVQVVTVTPLIVTPDDKRDVDLVVTISGKENLGYGLGPGAADNFFLSGVSFQGYLATVTDNSGVIADANYQALVDQIVAAINSHELFGDKITASRSTNNLVLTSKSDKFKFEVTIAAEFGSFVLTTPGVYPTLPAEEVQRTFPITAYKAGYSPAVFPDGSVTDWSRYFFQIEKDPAYSLDGANHLDKYVEEVEFYVPTAVAEASTGLNWDEKIYDFLTEIGYSDPDGDTTPWDLLFTV